MYTPTSDEKIAIDEAEKLMTVKMNAFADSSHDVYHVQRVRKTAMVIAEAMPVKPDFFMIELAALLHDVMDRKYVSADVNPETFFREFFASVASKTAIDLNSDGRGEEIMRVIQNVSWTNERKLRENNLWSKWHEESLELHCVQDADRLDSIGAIGIMRCAAYNAAKYNALYLAPDDPLRSESAIDVFHDRLIHVYDRLKTDHGKLLGKKKHQLLVDFMAAADDEFNDVVS
ncbi:hypothetical protein C8J56DRAFT_949981 [Mycena floridula]|nr:hypothetical protein C8J56DRAFT_949981 [Mycena floridula]